jgi:predicted metal-dependent phosphoesterase TrpH
MIDLHVHSTCSDGTVTPAELIRLAEEVGVSAVALCDHNTVEGLSEFLEAARGSKVEAVPGVEFSTDYEGKELHILSLFITEDAYDSIKSLLSDMLERKEESNRALVRNLNNAGIRLDYDRIKASAAGVVNRAVIGAEMVRLGYCETVKEAFKNWLAPAHGFFQPPERLETLETIAFIRSVGAVSVLAHPFLSLEEQQLRRFLEKAVPVGLDAMEVWYGEFSPEQTQLAKDIAEEFGLLPSGGSDFHGANKPGLDLGIGRGKLQVPDFCLELLARRQKEKRK